MRLALGLMLVAASATATERRFGWTQEAATLEHGRAVELRAHPQLSREQQYVRWDQRAAVQLALRSTLQADFGIEISAIAEGALPVHRVSAGVTSEWRWRFLSGPFMAALQATANVSERRAALAPRLILDARAGPLLAALNVGAGAELTFDGAPPAWTLAASAGTTWRVTDRFHAGVELRGDSVYRGRRFAGAALSMGPVLGQTFESSWWSLSFTPQVGALKSAEARSTSRDPLELREHARFAGWFLFGFRS